MSAWRPLCSNSGRERAQRDIDLRPELYTRFYKNEFPKRYHAKMDTRRWGPGERIVFEPYTRESFDDSQRWIAEHGIFEAGKMGSGRYFDNENPARSQHPEAVSHGKIVTLDMLKYI